MIATIWIQDHSKLSDKCSSITNVQFLGESAKGKYPVQSILMMDKILEQTEKFGSIHSQPVEVKPDGHSADQGMAYVSNLHTVLTSVILVAQITIIYTT